MNMTLLVIFGAIWFWCVLAAACLTSPVYDNKIDEFRLRMKKEGRVLNMEKYYNGTEEYSDPRATSPYHANYGAYQF